jgi:hypothetical protein
LFRSFFGILFQVLRGFFVLEASPSGPSFRKPLARVSERVQLFSRLLTRSLLYKKLNCIHRNPVIEMIVEKEEDDHFSSVRNNADPDSLIEITRESKLLITY